MSKGSRMLGHGTESGQTGDMIIQAIASLFKVTSDSCSQPAELCLHVGSTTYETLGSGWQAARGRTDPTGDRPERADLHERTG